MAQAQNSFANDDAFRVLDNKYRSKEPVDLEDYLFGTHTDGKASSECHGDMSLLWTKEMGASVYSTPLITDVNNDGRKDLVVTTFAHFVEVLDLETGDHLPGWPYSFQKSKIQASPLMVDIDGDGVREIMVSLFDGEIVFLREDGSPILGETLKVPRLSVRKHWFHGLGAADLDEPYVSVYDTSEGIQDGQRRLLEDFEDNVDDNVLSDEARQSLDLFSPDELWSLEEGDPLKSPHFDRYHSASKYPENDPEYVYVDAHILATPVLADLDGDGSPELVVSVSYYFDREFYSEASHRRQLPPDIDIGKYVAGGVVVFDLKNRTLKFEAHLDLTTDYTKFRAFITSSPTVADVDGDGTLDIVVGTSVGFVYVLHNDGRVMGDFPVMMDDVQGQVAVADVDGNGDLELIATDNNANVVCFTSKGDELWESRLSGPVFDSVSIGDINNDGVLDIVAATESGQVWALRGDTGEHLPRFPITSKGRISSPPVLAKLSEHSAGLQVVVPSFDGYLYIIDGVTGCTDKLDIGEASYTAVLLEDTTGNGKLDMIMSTINGNVFAITTEAPYDPLLAWPSKTVGRSSTVVRYGTRGIKFVNRDVRDTTGKWWSVTFEIVDKTPAVKLFNVKISVGGSVVLWEGMYQSPGTYTVAVPAPAQRMWATVLIEMTTGDLELFSDELTVGFNVHFYRLLKWFIFLPFCAMVFAVWNIRKFTSLLPH